MCDMKIEIAVSVNRMQSTERKRKRVVKTDQTALQRDLLLQSLGNYLPRKLAVSILWTELRVWDVVIVMRVTKVENHRMLMTVCIFFSFFFFLSCWLWWMTPEMVQRHHFEFASFRHLVRSQDRVNSSVSRKVTSLLFVYWIYLLTIYWCYLNVFFCILNLLSSNYLSNFV